MDTESKAKIERLIADMAHYAGGSTSDTIQRPMMARIHFMIAVDQAELAQKLEDQARVLIKAVGTLTDGISRLEKEAKFLRWLTVGLLALTAGLLILTVGLLVFTVRPIVAPQLPNPQSEYHAPSDKTYQPTDAQPVQRMSASAVSGSGMLWEGAHR